MANTYPVATAKIYGNRYKDADAKDWYNTQMLMAMIHAYLSTHRRK